MNFMYILLPDVYIQQVMQYLQHCDKDKNCCSLLKDGMCNRKYFYNTCILNAHSYMERFSKRKFGSGKSGFDSNISATARGSDHLITTSTF